MSNLKHLNLNLNGNVTFFVDFNGTRIIVLKGRMDHANDMPRLYRLAREALTEINSYLRLAA